MHPLHLFKYCPECGSPRFVEHNAKSKHCEACGFTYYFNPSAATVALIEREVIDEAVNGQPEQSLNSKSLNRQSEQSLNRKSEWCVVRRAKDPAKGTLDLPGGFCDMYETVEEGMRREIKEETGLDVIDIQYLFSSPNVYMYSGLGVHTVDMDFLVRVHGDAIAVTAADDATEAQWIPINKVNPAEFGLTSIRNAVIRFLAETLRK